MSIFSFTNGKAAKFILYGGLPSLAIYGCLYISCAAAFGSLEQLLDSYHQAAEQLQNTAMRFKGLHSVPAARCNLTLAVKRLPQHCKSAVQPFRSAFGALPSVAQFVRVMAHQCSVYLWFWKHDVVTNIFTLKAEHYERYQKLFFTPKRRDEHPCPF